MLGLELAETLRSDLMLKVRFSDAKRNVLYAACNPINKINLISGIHTLPLGIQVESKGGVPLFDRRDILEERL